jgi:hypothetical protein
MCRGQTKGESICEVIANVVIGYIVNIIAQLIMFPAFSIHVPIRANLWIGAILTIISFIRMYYIRRYFNGADNGDK